MASQGTAFHSLVIDNCSWSLSVRVRFASPVLVYTCRMHIFGSVSVCILWIARSYGGPCLRRPQGLGRAHKGHFIPGILYRLHTSFLPYDRRKEQKNDARADKRGRQSAAGRRNFKSQPTVMRDKNRSMFNSDRQTDQFSVCQHHSQIRIGRMIDCIVGNSQHCDFLSFNVLL